MSQEQPRRNAPQGEPIRYGNVFDVCGDLSAKTVAPEDANMMQAAETRAFGQTQKGGPAAAMQSAAARNEQAGFVGHGDTTDVAGDQGVTVTQTDIPGARITTEFVGGEVVGQYVEPTPVGQTLAVDRTAQAAITIGEALEAIVQSGGHKPVEPSDAAAIQAAESRATGSNIIVPGGLAATAQSAVSHNLSQSCDEDKIKLADVLQEATAKLPADKAVTKQDAEGVSSAELRNNHDLSNHPGGVAAPMVAAARLNERTAIL